MKLNLKVSPLLLDFLEKMQISGQVPIKGLRKLPKISQAQIPVLNELTFFKSLLKSQSNQESMTTIFKIVLSLTKDFLEGWSNSTAQR